MRQGMKNKTTLRERFNLCLATGAEPISKEEKIVFAIIEDLEDRRGLGQEWDNIDDEIQEAIIEQWILIVKLKLIDSK